MKQLSTSIHEISKWIQIDPNPGVLENNALGKLAEAKGLMKLDSGQASGPMWFQGNLTETETNELVFRENEELGLDLLDICDRVKNATS